MTILKYAGGKKGYVADTVAYCAESLYRERPSIDTYIEPFLGGGAVAEAVLRRANPPEHFRLSDGSFFVVYVLRELIADLNEVWLQFTDLVETRWSREDFDIVKAHLNRHHPKTPPQTPETAAQILYLNRACFNGLTRFSAKTGFNVPWGQYKQPNAETLFGLRVKIVHSLDLYAIARTLYIDRADFGQALNLNEVDPMKSLVYCDPPYIDTFNGYSGKWTQEDASRLVHTLSSFPYVILSHSDCPWIREVLSVHSNRWVIKEVSAPTAISARTKGRGRRADILAFTKYVWSMMDRRREHSHV